MHALNPIIDHAIHSDEQERNVQTAPHVLFIDDVVGITVLGENEAMLKYEVWVMASLVREGESGPIDINSCDMREIFLHVAGLKEPVEIKERHFLISHRNDFKRLENAVDLYILNRGQHSNDWEIEE